MKANEIDVTSLAAAGSCEIRAVHLVVSDQLMFLPYKTKQRCWQRGKELCGKLLEVCKQRAKPGKRSTRQMGTLILRLLSARRFPNLR